MKKNLSLLTGIVLLITVLVAGACNPDKVPQAEDDLSVVKIYVKAKTNGEKHLLMYDSNDPKNVVEDELVTDVKDNSQVFWLLADSSGLKKIKKIRPKNPDGKIIPKNAKGIWLFKKYKKHIVPDNQTLGDKEKYYIKVKDKDGNKWEIDPYLRIRE